MPTTEQPGTQGQSRHAVIASRAVQAESAPEVQGTASISRLLKNLRGRKTLRQVEADTGISNTYLCKLELGIKGPEPKPCPSCQPIMASQ